MTLVQPFSGGNPLQIAKKIVDEEYEAIKDEYYSPMLIQTVKKCMTATESERPNIIELCQLIVDIIMNHLDYMREKDSVITLEIKQLKEKLRFFEGPTSTGFKGFSTIEA